MSQQKTHDRFQPWVFVESFFSEATSTNSVVGYPYDYSYYQDLSALDHVKDQISNGTPVVKW